MRLAIAVIVSVFALAGCQTAQQAGNPGSCNQVGSTISSGVICPD